MKHKLTLRSLLKPLPVRNVDGTLNRQEPFAIRPSRPYESRTMPRTFHEERAGTLCHLPCQTKILSLARIGSVPTNPEVNWSRSQIVFSRCPVSCHLSKYPVSVEPVVPIRKHTTINQLSLDPVPDFYDDLDFLDAGLDIFLSLYRLIKEDLLQISAKPPPLPSLLLVLPLLPLCSSSCQYRMYAKVFSEQASHRLPQHQPWIMSLI